MSEVPDVEEARELNYTCTRRRDQFGRQCFFSESPTELLVDIQPDKSLRKNFFPRYSIERSTQNAPIMSEHEVNTEHHVSESKGINHTEGGWPKDVNPEDPEQTSRFRKKVEKDDEFINEMLKLSEIVTDCILENNAINVYQEYFKGKVSDREGPPTARTLNVFRDPNTAKRSASTVCWSPEGGTHILVAYCNLHFQGMKSGVSTESYIWDIENSYKPHMVLRPPSAAVCLEYNPKDPNLIVGGLLSGQVACWDVRGGALPTQITPPEIGHNDPVYSALWIQAKSGTECFTAGTDGQVLWWDVRNLSQRLDQVILDPNRGEDPLLERAQGATILEYEPTIPSRFLVGTEVGTVMLCNRKAKSNQEKVTAVFSTHLGPVYALQRNPIFPKNFLTVGDWCAKVWSEDVKDISIMLSRWSESHMTGGCWSPIRPSIFFTITSAGLIEAWDILVRHSSPVLSMKVVDESLNSLRCHDKGTVIACGSFLGTVTLVEVSESLSSIRKNDKSLATEMFEREARREKIIEARHREQKLKEKAEARLADKRDKITKEEEFDYEALQWDYETMVAEEKQAANEKKLSFFTYNM